MNNEELIRKITEEVMRKLGTNCPSQSQPCDQRKQQILSEIRHLEEKLSALKSELSCMGGPMPVQGTAPQDVKAVVSSGSASFCDPTNCTGCGYCVINNQKSVSQLVDAGAVRIGSRSGIPSVPDQIGSFIDHTLLKPDATAEQIIKLCDEARKHIFASVCVNPAWVALAARMLAGTPVRVCTVIGFPLGATPPSVKAYETKRAIEDGAEEIDMVINVGALRSKNYGLVEDDIRRVVEAAGGKLVKVILETALLEDEEKIVACGLAKSAGAHYVKTSTGFGPGGATAKDIALMRKSVGEDMGVKASGGVRDAQTAMEMITAGATRIGASASVAIVSGGQGKGNY